MPRPLAPVIATMCLHGCSAGFAAKCAVGSHIAIHDRVTAERLTGQYDLVARDEATKPPAEFVWRLWLWPVDSSWPRAPRAWAEIRLLGRAEHILGGRPVLDGDPGLRGRLQNVQLTGDTLEILWLFGAMTPARRPYVGGSEQLVLERVGDQGFAGSFKYQSGLPSGEIIIRGPGDTTTWLPPRGEYCARRRAA